MSRAKHIAHSLGKGKEVPNGNGFLTFCPVHLNEKTPSLAIWDDGKGGVNVHCHGVGCDYKEIKDKYKNDIQQVFIQKSFIRNEHFS